MNLKTIDWDKIDNSINLFTFYGETKLAKCVDVYDGDTIKVVFPLENKLYKWNCRLSGIDTPELRTKNKKEKELGYIVRDKLREKIFNKIIHVKCDKFDKYGRLLIEIFLDDKDCLEQKGGGIYNEKSINNWLIEKKYAFKYDGGKKMSWEKYLSN